MLCLADTDAVQDVVFGFGTVFWFAQDNPNVINGALADLTKDGSDWTSADLSTMARFHEPKTLAPSQRLIAQLGSP